MHDYNMEDVLILSDDRKTVEGVKDNSITHASIPEGVTNIGRLHVPIFTNEGRAFSGCTSLQSVDIPNSVKTIGQSAFSGCTSLQSVDIPNSVEEICSCAFQYCISLWDIDIPRSVKIIRGAAFSGCESLRSISIPNSLTNIEGGTFKDCKVLENIVIPEGVISIGASAFEGCVSIKTINIPNSVTKIGTGAFKGCTSLQSISISRNITIIESDTFKGCSSLRVIDIPESVNYIGTSAFSGCESLQSIVIPNSVTRLGWDVFSCCTSLKHIELPHKVTEIVPYMFASCPNLHYIIPDRIIKIGEFAFEEIGVEKFFIPKTIESIKGHVFDYSQIKEFIVDDENPCYVSVNGVLMEICSGNKKKNKLFTLHTYPPMMELSQYFIDSNIIKKIKGGAFYGCWNLKGIHIVLEDPNEIEVECDAFSEELLEDCILYIATGTRWAYKHHPVFGKFKNIEIE